MGEGDRPEGAGRRADRRGGGPNGATGREGGDPAGGEGRIRCILGIGGSVGGQHAGAGVRVGGVMNPREADMGTATEREPAARMRELLGMMERLSRAREPEEVIEALLSGYQEAYGRRGFVRLDVEGLEAGRYRITAARLGGREMAMPAERVWEGGFCGEVVRSDGPRVWASLRGEADPVLGEALRGYASAAAVPLYAGGKRSGWAVVLSPEGEAFGPRDLEDMIVRANLVETMVRHLETARRLEEATAWIQSEVDHIARIQQSMLPRRIPKIPRTVIACSYETFDRAGGDYYALLPVAAEPGLHDDEEARRWGLFIADASGHGPAAAVVIAMVHALLHSYPREPAGPLEVLEHLNRHLYRRAIDGSFVTAFFGIFEPATGCLTYARAGHDPPLLKNPGERSPRRRLDEGGGWPLGISPVLNAREHTIRLEAGQTLVLYTDGVTETRCPDGSLFGIEGIERAIDACTGEPDCIVGHIRHALMCHEGGRRPADDQTIVAIQVV